MGVTELPRRSQRDPQLFCFEGDFDVANLEAIELVLIGAVADSGAHRVILDLSGVAFMSVGTVTMLERLRRRLATTGRSLVIRSPSRKARLVLDRLTVTYAPPFGLDLGRDPDGTDSGMHSSTST
jgi:anti-anti-sigma regulatory factor